MEQLLPLLLWHGFCTVKHFAKVYYLYGIAPPSPRRVMLYVKASLP